MNPRTVITLVWVLTLVSGTLWRPSSAAASRTIPPGEPALELTVVNDQAAKARLTEADDSGEMIQGASQLLANGGFEDAAWAPWQTAGAPSLDTGVKHSGARAAHLGNTNNADDQVLQNVAIPALASAITVDFWVRLATAETDAECDFFYFGLWDQAGTTRYVEQREDFAQAGNLDWTHVTYALSPAEISSVAGQTVVLGLIVQTDGGLTSRAWVDDVALTVTTSGTASSSKAYLPLVAKPSAGSPPVIHGFSANPASINPGGSSALSWNVTGAASLSLSPGIGAVTGSGATVNPPATTMYTLTATNAYGSASAQVTVTVTTAPPPATGGFFLMPVPSIETPTSHPTVKVDAAGGVHVVYTPQSARPTSPTRPAFYAYCAANCTSAAAFTTLTLGDGVDVASLGLDGAGRPRLLLRKPAPGSRMFAYEYWTCDSTCLNPAQWTSGVIAYSYGRPAGWVESFIRGFALDPQGRPRFVYYDAGADSNDPHWGVFYASCDSGCTTAANWRDVRLMEDQSARDFALAFSPAGQPRLAYATYDSENIAQLVAYAECNQNCAAAGSWSSAWLASTVSASVSHFATFALSVTTGGKPRLALYTGTGAGGSLSPGQVHYLACDAASCAQAQAWSALDLGLPSTHGEEGVDLALDGQNRPRIAYHAPMAAGFGLHYAWCNVTCATFAQGWQYQEKEPSEVVNQALPIPPWPGCAFPQCNPPVPPCTISTWDTGVRPSLALDTGGHPRVAYDANHEQGGGCGTFTDTKLTRYMQFVQP